jgi:hypothetical protein
MTLTVLTVYLDPIGTPASRSSANSSRAFTIRAPLEESLFFI